MLVCTIHQQFEKYLISCRCVLLYQFVLDYTSSLQHQSKKYYILKSPPVNILFFNSFNLIKRRNLLVNNRTGTTYDLDYITVSHTHQKQPGLVRYK